MTTNKLLKKSFLFLLLPPPRPDPLALLLLLLPPRPDHPHSDEEEDGEVKADVKVDDETKPDASPERPLSLQQKSKQYQALETTKLESDLAVTVLQKQLEEMTKMKEEAETKKLEAEKELLSVLAKTEKYFVSSSRINDAINATTTENGEGGKWVVPEQIDLNDFSSAERLIEVEHRLLRLGLRVDEEQFGEDGDGTAYEDLINMDGPANKRKGHVNHAFVAAPILGKQPVSFYADEGNPEVTVPTEYQPEDSLNNSLNTEEEEDNSYESMERTDEQPPPQEEKRFDQILTSAPEPAARQPLVKSNSRNSQVSPKPERVVAKTTTFSAKEMFVKPSNNLNEGCSKKTLTGEMRTKPVTVKKESMLLQTKRSVSPTSFQQVLNETAAKPIAPRPISARDRMKIRDELDPRKAREVAKARDGRSKSPMRREGSSKFPNPSSNPHIAKLALNVNTETMPSPGTREFNDYQHVVNNSFLPKHSPSKRLHKIDKKMGAVLAFKRNSTMANSPRNNNNANNGVGNGTSPAKINTTAGGEYDISLEELAANNY